MNSSDSRGKYGVISVRKVAVLFVVLSAIALAFSNQLGSVIPSMDVESVTLTLVFNEPFVESYNIQSNPSKTIYSLSLNGVNGKDMNLPLRMGPVEGLWIRQEPSRLSVNTALLTPARVEPEIIVRENVVIIRFFRSSAEVDIDKFTTYGMTIASAMTYLFSEEILNLSYILSPSVRDEKILVGFNLALPEEILRNILTSLGDKVAYAYLSDGTFYLGTPDEVRELVNTFWRTYIGVEFNVDGETVSEQVERLRKTLPVNSFIEYLPNEASLMVFGDLQTHFMLSSLLTTNIVTKEFTAPSEATSTGVEPLTAYETLARELNSILFSDSVTISTIPQFNRIILSGNSKYVDELLEYLELYRKNLTSEKLDSSRIRITYTLPENFFLVEDVLRLGSSSGSGLPGDGTIVGTILNLLQSYSKDSVTVDRTFEPVGKVTFDLPKYLVEFVEKTMESFSKISEGVTYSVIKYHMPVVEETISQVEKITGAVIETIGEKKGYIIKGSKASIETAQYVLSLFTGITFEDYRNTYIELKAENTFNEVKSFFDSYFASRGLVVDEYSLEQISEKLIYIYAPSDILDEALVELENREKQIFRKTEDLILEVAPEIYDSGLGELIDTLLNPEESKVFIRSAGLIVLRGYPERLSELAKIIETRVPRIVEMIEKNLSEQEARISLQIGSIPGWDLDKFQTYLRDFLGPDEFATITVTRSGNGFIVVGPESLLNTVDGEAEKLRMLENPFYRLESSIPSLSQFESLLERLGIAVSIIPVDNQFMVVGSQENVEEVSRLISQLGSGLPVGGEVTVPGTVYNYAFVNIPYGEVAGLSELLEKLNLPVEFVNTPTGVAAVAPEERLKKAMEVVESILSRLEPLETGPIGYSLVDVDPGSLESLKTIVEKLKIEVDFVDTPSGIVGIGSDVHLGIVKKLVEDLLKKESVTPTQGDKETGYMIFRGRSDISIDSLKSVVQVFGYDLTFTPVYDKIVAVGDRYDLNSFNALYGEILSSESVEDARVSVELPGIPGWDPTRLAAYLRVVFGEKVEEISLIQTSKGYILNAPGSMTGAISEEFERLSRIENPSYSIETRMPNITEIDNLLARLGIIVDILKVEDYSVVVGSSENVAKARELITKLVDTLGVPEQTKPQIFKLSAITSGDMEYFVPIFDSIDIEVALLESPAGILIVGKEDQVNKALEIANNILERKPSQEVSIVYEFVDIPSDGVAIYGEILKRLGLNVELFSSPAGVLLIGTEEDIDKARPIIEAILEREAKTIVQSDERQRVSMIVKNIPGWTEDKFTDYFRSLLGEGEFAGISITPSFSGFIVIGAERTLTKIQTEVVRLSEIEDPFYLVKDALPPVDQLGRLLERLGLNVNILPVGEKNLIVGTESDVIKTGELIDTLKTDLDTGDVKYVYRFSDVNPQFKGVVESILSSLKIEVGLIEAGNNMVIVGLEKEVNAAKEILDDVSAQIVDNTAEGKIGYSFVGVESSQIESYGGILERLGYEVDLLSSPSGVLVIGEEKAVKSAVEIINAILAREEEIESKVGESVRVSTVLSVVPGWDQQKTFDYFRDFLGEDEYSRISLTPSAGGYIVVGPEETVKKLETEISRLAQLEHPFFTIEKSIPALDKFEQLLATLGIKVNIIVLEDRYLIVGTKENVISTSDILHQIVETIYPDSATQEEPPAELGFTLIETIPEDIPVLASVINKLDIPVDIVGISSGAIVIGQADRLEEASGVIESILKHRESLYSKPEPDYRFVDIEAPLIDQLLPVMQKLEIQVEFLETPTGVIAIGAPQELSRAIGLIDSLMSREVPEIPQKEKHESYLLLPLTQGLSVEALTPLLKTFEYDISLLGISDKLIAIGREEDLVKFKSLYKSLQAQEIDRESRVSIEIKNIPGWTTEDFGQYARFFLGADDFARISILESVGGYVVLTPLDLKEPIESELERIRKFEDPEFVVKEKLPPVEDLTGLLARLGVVVDLVPMGSSAIIIGSSDAVQRAGEILNRLLGSLIVETVEEEPLEYRILDIPDEDTASLQEILDRLGVDVSLLSSPSGVVAIGTGSTIEKASSIVADIMSKRISPQVEEPVYTFTEIPLADIQSYQAILNKIGAGVELMQSPSGVLIVGTGEKVEKALKTVNAVLAKEVEMSSAGEQPRRVSTVLSVVPGWSDDKYSGYFRDYLGEDDFGRISITPSTGGYIVIGPQEVLDRMEKEATRLTSIEDPYYIVEEKLPAIEELGTLLERLGLKVTILPIEDRYLVVGKKESVEKASQFISTLKAGMQPAVEEPQGFEFVEIEAQYIDSLERTLEELKVKVQLIQIGNNVVMIGSSKDLEAGRELLTPIAERLKETPVEKKVTYSFVGVESSQIESYGGILERLGYEVDLLSSPSGVLVIGEEKAVKSAVEIINAILAREEEIESKVGESVRVSTVLSVVPGWSDDKYSGYFRDYLGEDDFGRISITPSTGGYIVIGPQEVLDRMEKEATRLTSIEDPYYIVEEKLPAIEELGTLLERLGLKVTILPIEDRYLVVGKKESVTRTVDLIQMLRRDVESPVASREYEYTILEAGSQVLEIVRQVLEEMKIAVTVIGYGNNMIIVGYREAIDSAVDIISSISDRTDVIAVDEKLKYVFTEIPIDKMDEFSNILDNLKLPVKLLSSPSGVILVGEELETDKALEVVQSILSKLEIDETTESRLFNNLVGWEEGKLTTYLRSYLGEKDWAKISITSIQSGYLIVGPSGVLDRIQKELSRLTGLEKPHYRIVDSLPSVQNLELLFERMGLSVTVVITDGKTMLIGPERDILQALKVLDELKEDVEITQTGDQILFTFIDIPTEEIENFKAIFERLGITVDILGTPTGTIVVGVQGAIDRARETATSILSRREAQIVPGVQSYLALEIRDGFDLAAAQSVISAFNLNVYPLSVAGKLVMIGTQSELERFLTIRNDIVDEHRITAIVPREVTLEELNGIKETLKLDVSVFEMRNSFVVYGKEQDISNLRSILNEVAVKQPAEEAPQIETLTNVGVDLDYLREILASMGINIKVYGEGDSIVAVGKPSELNSLKNLLKKIDSTSTATETTVAFYPLLEGWTGEILGNFLQAMNVDVLVFQESSRGYLLIGVRKDLEKVKALLDDLDIKIKKATELYAIPSGMEFEELRDTLLSSGFNLSYTRLGQSMSISGPEEDVKMAIAMLDEIIRSGLGKALSYTLIDLPAELTLEKFQKIMTDMGLSISTVQIDSRLMLIGPDSDLRKAGDIVEYLRPEEALEDIEKIYSVVALPETLTMEEAGLLAERLGLNVEMIPVAGNIVVIGTTGSVDSFKSLMTNISGALEGGSKETVSYKISSLPSGVGLTEFESLLDSLKISSRIVQVSDSIVFVGTSEENALAEKLLSEFRPEEVPVQYVTREYTTISMPTGFDLASLSGILEKIGLEADLTQVGNVLILVGDPQSLPKVVSVISDLHGTSSRPEVMKLAYEVIDVPADMNIDVVNEAINSLKIPSTIIRNGNKLLVTGSIADIEETRRLVEIFRPEQSAESVEKAYRLLSLPSGFTLFDVEKALGKTGIELELLQVGNVLLLAGKTESLDEAESLLEKLIMVSTGDTGERNTYEIVKIKEGVTTQLLGQLFRLIGISVEILENEDWMVFTGSEGGVKAALDVFESLSKDIGGTEEPLSYTITILPKNLTIGQLQTAFESIQIPIRLIEAGDYAIMVGTKDSLSKGQQLISSLRIGIDASGTSTDGSISYVTFAMPVGTEIGQLETIAGLMELKLKFQIVGDRVFMIGTEKDLKSFEEILKGLVVEKTGVINQFRFIKAITGIDSVTLNMYLTAKGIGLAGIYDVSGGYLLVGDTESIDLAQAAVNYIDDNQRVHFEYVDLPENLDPEILQRMAEDLLLDVSIIQVSPSRYMLVGAAEDVQNLITVIFQAAGAGEKLLDYSIVALSPTLEKELDLEALRNILEEIGIKVTIGKFSGRLIFVGKANAIEASTNLLEKLRTSMEENGSGKQTFYELPVIGGWSVVDIQNYLEAAGIKLGSVIEYAGRIVGIGAQNDLAMAEEALLFIANKAARESVRIDKGLVTQIQLSEMISKLNLKAEFVELDKQWLLIGDPDSLMKLTKTIEEAAADREISRYVTDLTVDPQELASLLREAIDGLTVQTFENLQMILLKSKSSMVLDNAEAMIKNVQESRKAVDPVEKGVTVSGSKIGIDVVNQDLERLLRVVAGKLDIPLLFIDVIDENITMSVKEIDWESLVKVINATKPVSISRIDNIYAVTKKEQKSGQEATDIELVYRVYHNVEEVTKLIEFYGGEVLSDPVNGYIVVRGLAKSKVDSIFDEIASSLAKPKKQVRIETKLVDKSLVDEMQRDFTTSLEITNPDVIIQNGSIDLNFKIFENLDISKILDSIVNTANANISADLKDRDADSDLISSPSIVSMSGEEATIHIGDTIPYLVKKIEYVDGRPVEIETIENLNTGVELRITPTVNDDGKILLDLYIKVSEPEKYVDGTRTLYGEKTREAKSKLVIGDGNTLTIGGLVANKDSVNVNKMPFLSDLPFIGKLFTTETKTTDKRELVIFITAEVVQP
ncbi:putative Type II secretory pathway, component HofQ [Mesotoga infera]|uniref:Putative Type II secretory pathway, component HofQ n=1 Tax=Mesotoga infera TaxID=1236046 RepID=A0A7Z7PMD9_9BACT|nr:putative Type II secretory pathway, component HofQ [Mesotoga infera]